MSTLLIQMSLENFIIFNLIIINAIAPMKETRIKTNSQDWFDGDVSEQIRLRNKLLRKFKSSID